MSDATGFEQFPVEVVIVNSGMVKVYTLNTVLMLLYIYLLPHISSFISVYDYDYDYYLRETTDNGRLSVYTG